MIELLNAQLTLAAAMMRLKSLSPEERTAWRTYQDTVAAMLDREHNPRPPRRQPPPIPTRP